MVPKCQTKFQIQRPRDTRPHARPDGTFRSTLSNSNEQQAQSWVTLSRPQGIIDPTSHNNIGHKGASPRPTKLLIMRGGRVMIPHDAGREPRTDSPKISQPSGKIRSPKPAEDTIFVGKCSGGPAIRPKFQTENEKVCAAGEIFLKVMRAPHAVLLCCCAVSFLRTAASILSNTLPSSAMIE